MVCYSEYIKQKEGIVMETTFYTFSANEIVVAGSGVKQVSGGQGRRMVYLRHTEPRTASPSAGKVIDFDTWRARNEDAVDEMKFSTAMQMEEVYGGGVRAERTGSARRAVRGMYLDWLASVAVIAVAVSACVSFLM